MKREVKHYIIQKEIGRGGSGCVYLAEDSRLHRKWAIKEVHTGGAAGISREARSALAEARLLAALQHPAIPRVVDILPEGDVHLVVMDFVEGESLREYLSRRGGIPAAEVLRYAREICGILMYLHGCEPPVLYRDLKPENLIRGPDGALRLVDFGTAREAPAGEIRERMPRGTRGYAAPEQYRGLSSARSDIYAFGVILEEMLRVCRTGARAAARGMTGAGSGDAGRRSLQGRETMDGLRAIAMRAMAKEPDRRYADASALAADLAHPERCAGRYRLRRRRGMRLFAALLISSALLFVGAIFFRALSQYAIDQTCAYALHPPGGLSQEEREMLLYEAADLAPRRFDLYAAILAQYETERFFDDARATRLSTCFFRQGASLDCAPEAKAELLYRAARLCWYVYSGGDRTARTRILMAQPWIEQLADICSDLPEARWPCSRAVLSGYQTIADFYARYATDPGLVADPDRDALLALLDAIGSAVSGGDVVEAGSGSAEGGGVTAHERLTFLQALLRLIRTHRIGFAAMGVEERRVTEAAEAIRLLAERTDPVRTETEVLQREILREASETLREIAHGYESLEE